MSILIKGMEMPCEEAEPLRIELYADGTVIVIKEAVPVPPHGRLIDADALEYEEAYLNGHYELGDVEIVTRKDIESAPTIIPAEPVGESET